MSCNCIQSKCICQKPSRKWLYLNLCRERPGWVHSPNKELRSRPQVDEIGLFVGASCFWGGILHIVKEVGMRNEAAPKVVSYGHLIHLVIRLVRTSHPSLEITMVKLKKFQDEIAGDKLRWQNPGVEWTQKDIRWMKVLCAGDKVQVVSGEGRDGP